MHSFFQGQEDRAHVSAVAPQEDSFTLIFLTLFRAFRVGYAYILQAV